MRWLPLRWLLIAAQLWCAAPAAADDMLLLGVGQQKVAVANTLAFTSLPNGATSSTVACSGTYTGTAPSSFTSATYGGGLSGSPTLTGVTFSGGTWSATCPTPSGAGTGTLAVTTNLSTTATSPSATFSAGATWTLVNSVNIPGSASGGTSTDIDTSTANLIAITATYQESGGITFTDNKGNNACYAAHKLTPEVPALTYNSIIIYCISPTVGSGHHFTLAGNFGAAQITAWKDNVGTPSFDKEGGTNGISSPQSAGPKTPAANNSLIMSGAISCCSAGVPGVNSGMTLLDAAAFVGGVNYAYGGAYFLQGSAAAFNPQWTVTGSTGEGVTMAIFGP